MNPTRWLAPCTAALLLALAACAGALDEQAAHAAPPWPPLWQDAPVQPLGDEAPPAFTPPFATDCRRAPVTREVPGGAPAQGATDLRRRHHHGMADDSALALREEPTPTAKAAAPRPAPAEIATATAPWPQALNRFNPHAPPTNP